MIAAFLVLRFSVTLVPADGAICERRLCTDSLNRSRVKPVGKHRALLKIVLILVQWPTQGRCDSVNVCINIPASLLTLIQFQKISFVSKIFSLKLLPNISDSVRLSHTARNSSRNAAVTKAAI